MSDINEYAERAEAEANSLEDTKFKNALKTVIYLCLSFLALMKRAVDKYTGGSQ